MLNPQAQDARMWQMVVCVCLVAAGCAIAIVHACAAVKIMNRAGI